jgi:NodT family efflux transporter outer membrane factor (OMF) lipoprotein
MIGPRETRRRRRALAAGAIACLAGCDVGPRYRPPITASPPEFKESAPAAYKDAAADAWRPARPQDARLKGKWWTLFGEPELDALEEELDINNQTIAQYFQNFMAARAQVSEARAGYFPTLSTAPSYSNSGVFVKGATSTGSAAAATTSTSVAAGGAASSAAYGSGSYFTIPLEASWAPDLWGRVRNAVREYQNAAQVSAADLENERLTEQAALAEYYFELRGQDALQQLYDRTISAYRQSLDYNRAQSETGIGTEEAVAQAEVTLRNAEVTATGLATNRALYEHAIATLVGRPASSFSMPVRALATAVPDVPVGVPSQLLERRPDIAAAERTMAQANALIGVGTAAYYPSLNLSASTGIASATLGALFSMPAFFWSVGASLSETLFDGGLRGATVAPYRAQYEADAAAYRQTVLTAFQQVEDALSTVRVLSQEIRRSEEAIKAARRYAELATVQFQTGVGTYLDVMTAQTLALSDEQTLVTLRVNELTGAVQLVQALGGGWDLSRLPTASEVTTSAGLRKVAPPKPSVR